jgi:hypothetical protein
MGNFDVTTPAGSELLSQGDDKIREFKTAMREALRAGEVAGDDIEGVEAIFPGASPSTAPVYRYRGLKGTTAERPTAGQYGLYYDTTRNVLQRDNGSSWDDIGGSFPSGTSTIFCQASAPVGWTKSTSNNDKALRVVSGSGGGTGGTVGFSEYSNHTHTSSPHTLSVSEIPPHSHDIILVAYPGGGPDGPVSLGEADSHPVLTGATESVGGGSSHTHTPTTVATGQLAYVDVIVCSKD